MSQCNACECRIEAPKVKLVTGREVCSWCPDWLIECEARDLLRRPLEDRRAALVEREKKRGKQATDALRQVMIKIHAQARPV